MSRSADVPVEVIVNAEIAPGYFSLRLRGPSALARFRPGQFLMLGWADGLDPFLPRAMSIRGARPVPPDGGRGRARSSRRTGRPASRKAEVEILYKVYGHGTALWATMRPGRRLRALGPLGNAFKVPRSATKLLMVAGGIGVPPIVALAEALSGRRSSRDLEVTAFLGGKSKPDLLCIADLRRAGAAVHLATEDGSVGFKGFVTALLEEHLHRSSPSPGAVLYACGPVPMLSSLAIIAEKHDLSYQACLEANMGCGFGACMGCAIPIAGGEEHRTYSLVCKNGPVFDGRRILWT
ncbi:MAG: dihydroorotate dehydrogenase electron transfer subunit [Candidatus Methylomirabilaceae bacterium]